MVDASNFHVVSHFTDNDLGNNGAATAAITSNLVALRSNRSLHDGYKLWNISDRHFSSENSSKSYSCNTTSYDSN